MGLRQLIIISPAGDGPGHRERASTVDRLDSSDSRLDSPLVKRRLSLETHRLLETQLESLKNKRWGASSRATSRKARSPSATAARPTNPSFRQRARLGSSTLETAPSAAESPRDSSESTESVESLHRDSSPRESGWSGRGSGRVARFRRIEGRTRRGDAARPRPRLSPCRRCRRPVSEPSRRHGVTRVACGASARARLPRPVVARRTLERRGCALAPKRPARLGSAARSGDDAVTTGAPVSLSRERERPSGPGPAATLGGFRAKRPIGTSATLRTPARNSAAPTRVSIRRVSSSAERPPRRSPARST